MFLNVTQAGTDQNIIINLDHVVKVEPTPTTDRPLHPECWATEQYSEGDTWYRAKITMVAGDPVITEEAYDDICGAVEL